MNNRNILSRAGLYLAAAPLLILTLSCSRQTAPTSYVASPRSDMALNAQAKTHFAQAEAIVASEAAPASHTGEKAKYKSPRTRAASVASGASRWVPRLNPIHAEKSIALRWRPASVSKLIRHIDPAVGEDVVVQEKPPVWFNILAVVAAVAFVAGILISQGVFAAETLGDAGGSALMIGALVVLAVLLIIYIRKYASGARAKYEDDYFKGGEY